MNDLDLLYEALSTPHGVVVETNNVERLRAKLYALRKGDPQLACLSLIPSPSNPADLWILKKEQQDAPEE